jgi:hypothetical protein
MDFHLSERQQMFRDSVATFARKELADGALERAHMRGAFRMMWRRRWLERVCSEGQGGTSI